MGKRYATLCVIAIAGLAAAGALGQVSGRDLAWEASRIVRAPVGGGPDHLAVSTFPFVEIPARVREGANGTWWLLLRNTDLLEWVGVTASGEIGRGVVLQDHFMPSTAKQRIGWKVPDRFAPCRDFLPTNSGMYFTSHGRLFRADEAGETVEVKLGGEADDLYFGPLWPGAENRIVASFTRDYRSGDGGICVFTPDSGEAGTIVPIEGDRQYMRRVVAADGLGDVYVRLTTAERSPYCDGVEIHSAVGVLLHSMIFPQPWPNTWNDLLLVWPEKGWVAVAQYDMSKGRAEDPGTTAIYDVRSGELVARFGSIYADLPDENGWRGYVPPPYRLPLDTGSILKVKLTPEHWELWRVSIKGIPAE